MVACVTAGAKEFVDGMFKRGGRGGKGGAGGVFGVGGVC